jgi:hypothetical protein
VWKAIVDFVLSCLKKFMSDPTDLTIGLDALPIATSIVNAVGEGAKIYAQLEEQANSPDMKLAAAAKQKLAEIDDLVKAQKENNLQKEREAFENAKH